MLVELLAVGALQTALTPVSARDLTGLLDGVFLTRDGIVIVAGGEYFGPGGYHAMGDRAPRRGRWRAERGRLCNWSWPDGRDERCIPVLTDGRGAFYSADDEAALVKGRVYQIRFTPALTPQ